MLLAKSEDDLHSLLFHKSTIALANSDFVSMVHLLKFMVKVLQFFPENSGKLSPKLLIQKDAPLI